MAREARLAQVLPPFAVALHKVLEDGVRQTSPAAQVDYLSPIRAVEGVVVHV